MDRKRLVGVVTGVLLSVLCTVPAFAMGRGVYTDIKEFVCLVLTFVNTLLLIAVFLIFAVSIFRFFRALFCRETEANLNEIWNVMAFSVFCIIALLVIPAVLWGSI